MQLKDSRGQSVIISDTSFAKGGEGDVYKVTGKLYKDCCVKIFHKGKMAARKSKLDYMIKHPLNAPKNSVYRICQPKEFVFKDRECIGFIMPLAFDGSHSLYDINLKDGSELFARATERGMTNRMKVLYNIANVISIIHKHGYVLADFKPQNILFTDSGKISIIDMDSIQIVKDGKLVYRSTAATAEYAYPKELYFLKNKKALTPSWDVYSYAIVAYQVLLGIHPFAASTEAKDARGGGITTPDQLMANNLFPFGPRKREIYAKPPIHNYFLQIHQSLQEYFIQTFDLNRVPPTMDEWKALIKDTVTNRGLLPNMFRAKPKLPIFILTSDLPSNPKVGQQVTIEWLVFNCDKLIIKGVDKTGVTSTRLNIPEDRTVEIVASNKNATTIKKIVFSITSLFCSNCGSNFEHINDLYCTQCGTKRE